jgi:hypothetical protein
VAQAQVCKTCYTGSNPVTDLYALGMNIPLYPPKEWFNKPETIPTDKRITVEDTGRVYGYVALWDTCHVGMTNCVKPPKGSISDFDFAHQGETKLEDGSIIATANIGGGGHASLTASPEEAAAHYQEHTSTQLMRVRYGADETGLWFAGSLWPDVSEVDTAHIRASAVSGDWRWFAYWRNGNGSHDFVGACFVNIPGYPMSNAGEVAKQAGAMQVIAASGLAYAQSDIVTSYDPIQKELQVDCNCKTQEPIIVTASPEPKCPCGEKPATECGGECKDKTVTASPEDMMMEDEVEQPKMPLESNNEAIAALITKVEEMSSRIVAIEEMLAQMTASHMAKKLSM